MAIKYYNDGTDFRLPDKGRIGEWIAHAVEREGMVLGAVNFVFCGPERHLEINRHFLGHDWPTDVITFEYSNDNNFNGGKKARDGKARAEKTDRRKISGDIFIDPATVAGNAAAHCVAREVEMRRVMVHGVLHLCGYGDKTPKQQRRMRAKEDSYIAQYYGKNV